MSYGSSNKTFDLIKGSKHINCVVKKSGLVLVWFGLKYEWNLRFFENDTDFFIALN